MKEIAALILELTPTLDANQRAIIKRHLKAAFDNSNSDWPRIFQTLSESMADKKIDQFVDKFLDGK